MTIANRAGVAAMKSSMRSRAREKMLECETGRPSTDDIAHPLIDLLMVTARARR